MADLAPSLPIFDSIGITDESNDGSNLDLTESSGTLHPGQFDQVDELDGSNEQVAVIFTEIDKIVDRANIVVPPASDEATSLESRSNMHNRIEIKFFFLQSYKGPSLTPITHTQTHTRHSVLSSHSYSDIKPKVGGRLSRKIKGRKKHFPLTYFTHHIVVCVCVERKKKKN